MDIALTLDKVEMLVKSMSQADSIVRLHHNATIRTILKDMKDCTRASEDLKGTPNVGVYFAELEMPLQCLVGLLDYGKDDDDYIAWLYGGIDKLRSKHCYDLK